MEKGKKKVQSKLVDCILGAKLEIPRPEPHCLSLMNLVEDVNQESNGLLG